MASITSKASGLVGVIPSAYCAYSKSCARKSQVGGAFGAHLTCAMRLHCSHSTALLLTPCKHTLHMTAVEGSSGQDRISSRAEFQHTLPKCRLYKRVLARRNRVSSIVRHTRPLRRGVHDVFKPRPLLRGSRALEIWHFNLGQVPDDRLLLEVSADTPQERNAVLWAQLLNHSNGSPSVRISKRDQLTRLLRGEYFRSHSCSHRSSALGRFVGFLLKHCRRKSCNRTEQPSGRGGMPSSTIRNMTVVIGSYEY